jgi:prepilin-type N-terminal cleavage/methylation domain-containing protein
MKHKKHPKDGFTLIEALISVTIFAIVMTIAVGALVTIVDSNRKSQSMQLAVNNVNAAVDHMSWQIRGGSNYYCLDESGNTVNAENCTSTNQQPAIGFTARDDSVYTYRLVNGRIQRTIDNGFGSEEVADITSTSDLVTINRLSFSLFGDDASGTQPGVTIVVQGEAGVEGDTVSELSIQTSVSERLNVSYETGDASSLDRCPYMPAPGRYIVDFTDQRNDSAAVVVQSRQESSSDTRRPSEGLPPHPIGSTPLPPGRYEVSIATFDSHNDDYGQNAETVYLGLTNVGIADTEPFVYTGVSPELAHVPTYIYDTWLRLDDALVQSGAVPPSEGVAATMVNPHYMNMNYSSFLNMDSSNTTAYPNTYLTLTEEATHFYIYHAHPQATKKIATLDPRTYHPMSYPESPGQNLPAYTCPGVGNFVNFCNTTSNYYYRADGSGGRFSVADCIQALQDGFCPKGYGGGSHAHSLVFLCAAFDNLDATVEFDIEDF